MFLFQILRDSIILPLPYPYPYHYLCRNRNSACIWASQVALVVKTLFANGGDLKDLGSIPGWADFLEKAVASHSSILAWRTL